MMKGETDPYDEYLPDSEMAKQIRKWRRVSIVSVVSMAFMAGGIVGTVVGFVVGVIISVPMPW